MAGDINGLGKNDGNTSESMVSTSPTSDDMLEVCVRGELFTLCMVPEAGGKIIRLIHNATGFNLLWENPRVPLRRTYPGAPFDDLWCGGWDDLFPTDPPCEHNGNTFHDHGDLWIGPWDWTVESNSPDFAKIHLSRYSVSLPCRIEKWISVQRNDSKIDLRLRLSNLSAHPVRFVWNQHISHSIGPGSRIHLPAGRMGVVGSASASLGDVREISWPYHNSTDLSRMPDPSAGILEFLYALDLREGWCVVTHPSYGVAVRIEFDKHVFATPWLWRVFGGWRGHHFLLTEPCTSRPGGLASAIADGSAATLGAGASIDTEMAVTIAEDFDRDAPGDQDPLTI